MSVQGKRSRLGLLINTLASGHIHPVGTRRNVLQNGGNGGDREGDDDDASSQDSAGSFVEPKGQVRVNFMWKVLGRFCHVAWRSNLL